MHISHLLDKLHKVRQTGADRWVACCPAHEYKTPSLAVRACDDGRILLHCFAECAPHDILAAVALTFDDLFPEQITERARPLRRPFNAHDVLECISMESMIVILASADLRNGVALTDSDHARLLTAVARIQAARDLANG